MDTEMQDDLKKAHEEFRDNVKGKFIQDVNNKNIMTKVEQTISEHQGSLMSVDEMLEMLVDAKR